MIEFSAPGGDMHDGLRASVNQALANMAVLKNVPLKPALRDGLVASVLEHMTPADLYALADREAKGHATLTREINRHLDSTVQVWIMDAVASLEGKPGHLNDPVVQAVTNSIAERFAATQANPQCLRWPNFADLAELLRQHYAGKVRGPIVTVRDDGTICTRWWLGLNFHRDPKEGPANIEVKGESCLEEYYVEGKRHRPHEDGPAELLTEEIEGRGTRRVEVYWREDKLHRPHQEGPALTTTHYKDNFDLLGDEYFENGKEHRPAHLGAAITNWDRSGRMVLQMFMEEGQLHRDPKEGPAFFVIRDPITVKDRADNTNTTVTQYCVRGETHRDEEDGPAVMIRDNATSVALIEEYYRDGLLHRASGPAVTHRRQDGSIFFQSWYRAGGMHRDPAEGPAHIWNDSHDGTVLEEFCVGGASRHRSLGPARIYRRRDGTVISEEFWDGEEMQVTYHQSVEAEAAHG